MSQGFLDHPTICVSAVPGAMGPYLGALLYHAVNASATSLNYNVFDRVDQWPSQIVWKNFELSAVDNDIDQLRNNICADHSHQQIDADSIQVVVSQCLSPVQLAQLFPNAKHVKISATDRDIAQIGYNSLYYEFYHGNGSENIDDALAYVSDFLGISQDKAAWAELLDDILHRDNLAIRMAAMYIGKSSVKKCAAQDHGNAIVLEYAKLFPFWKVDRPVAGLMINDLLDKLDHAQTDPAHISAIWQELLTKINQIQAYKYTERS